MGVRRFALIVIPFIALMLGSASSALCQEKPTNIVLVMTDNQGYFELECKGNPYLKTPNINDFAKQGVDFCNFHAENFCSPSRAALLTGRQPMRMGVHNTVGGVSLLDPDETTLADRLKSAGYRTGIFGKWHLGMSYPFHPSLRGFEEVFVHGGGGIGQLEDYAGNRHMNAHFQDNGSWVECRGFSTDVLFDRAMEFMDASRDQPFFCYIPTPAVHFPVEAEPKALARIRARGVREDDTNLSLLSMIENIDDNLGRLIKYLEARQLRENTLVIFMADQGVGDRGSPSPVWPGRDRQQDLGNAGEGKHRVFCMMQFPGIAVAGPNEALTCIRDICPTILDVCGVSQPDNLDGRSLIPLLKGNPRWQDERILVMQCPRGREREKWKHAAVKQGDWRLVSESRLYNVREDSLMQNDLSGEHPELTEKLNSAYEAFWQSLPAEEDLVQRHVLGSKFAPSTLLCAMDWREGGSPWNSGALRDGFRGQGSWFVEVEQAGTYRFTLCRTMKETPLPLRAIEGTVSIGPVSASTRISEDSSQCVVEIDLEPGAFALKTELLGHSGSDDTWGANFVYVDLIQPKKRLPRVLIIGDSISLGYTPIVQGMLIDEVEIVRPPNANGGWINCEGTQRGIEMIDDWLSRGEFDLIHFNFGLHDLKHVDPKTGRNSTNEDDPQQSDPGQYEQNLRQIVAKLTKTNAKLIFATTTPYPDRPGGPLRRADQPKIYNAIARKIMEQNNIAVNELHELVLPRMDELLLPNNVHFRPSGNLALAKQVAHKITGALRNLEAAKK
ncbi:MAG: sulfatase-like hydrolase/transferase [Aureliella sp.]